MRDPFMANSIPDYDRCRRNDGRNWRCKFPRLGGELYCQKHYFYSRRKNRRPATVPNPAPIAKSSGEIKARVSKIDEKEPVQVGVSDPLPVGGTRKRGRPPKKKRERHGSAPKANLAEESDFVRARKAKRSDLGDGPSAATTTKKKRGRPRKMKTLEEINRMVACPTMEASKKRRGRPPKGKLMQEMVVVENAEGADRVLELGQVWAFFSVDSDGIPRSYARIDRIVPIPGVVHVTPLIPHPVLPEENLFVEKGIPLACGVFKASHSSLVVRISAFSHRVMFEGTRKGSLFKIFPEKGEVWAIYLQWSESKKSFDYELVEVESDFDEEIGLKVFILARVMGMDGVYRRHKLEEGLHLGQTFSRGFMQMFSHRVPASEISVDGEIRWKVLFH